MPFNEIIEVNNQLLLEGNFSAYIKNLYTLGVVLEKNFVRAVKNNSIETFADEMDKKKRFKKYVANHTRESIDNFLPGRHTKESLCIRLWNLQSFLIAWEDPEIRQQEDKKLRPAIKFKGDIDKYFRRRIHAALIAEVVRIQRAANGFLIEKKLAPIDFESKELTEYLADGIRALKSETPEHINQTFDKAAQAIASVTPMVDKFLHGFAICIGLLTALACGLATGGFLFLLFSGFGFPLVAAALAGLAMFAASTSQIMAFFLFIAVNFYARWQKAVASPKLSTKRVNASNCPCG